jgi:CheY-like chemotaxis protein
LKDFLVANTIVHLEDGEQAMEYFQHIGKDHKKPHLVLLDLRLPKVDGLDVLCYIKSQPELTDIPVVILTTSGAEMDVARAAKCHANSYLIKPVDFAKFNELMGVLGFYWICWNKKPF